MMWLEAVIAKEDLLAVVPQLVPLRVRWRSGGRLELDAPTAVALVPRQGVRLSCRAKLEWPVLGIKVPIVMHSVTALVAPQIASSEAGDRLVFGIVIEHADFAGLPDMVDSKVTEKINLAMAREPAQPEWNFSKTLTHLFRMPASVELLTGLGLRVSRGEVRISEDALVLGVAMQVHVQRAAGLPREPNATGEGRKEVGTPPGAPAE